MKPHFSADHEELLRSELQLIQKWEKEQKDLGFLERIGRIPLTILDRLTPKLIHRVLDSILLFEVRESIQTSRQYLSSEQSTLDQLITGEYLISEQSILEQLAKQANSPSCKLTLKDVPKLPIHVMNQVSEQLKKSRTKIAMLQGATNFSGISILDIPIPDDISNLIGLSLKVLQEMAITYGYDPQEKKEQTFINKCLQFSFSDLVGKRAILKDLSLFYEDNIEPETIIWREVIATYQKSYGRKKLFQLIPLIGRLFGAYINRSAIYDVAEAGQMLYRKRRVLEKLKEIEQTSENSSHKEIS